MARNTIILGEILQYFQYLHLFSIHCSKGMTTFTRLDSQIEYEYKNYVIKLIFTTELVNKPLEISKTMAFIGWMEVLLHTIGHFHTAYDFSCDGYVSYQPKEKLTFCNMKLLWCLFSQSRYYFLQVHICIIAKLNNLKLQTITLCVYVFTNCHHTTMFGNYDFFNVW